MAAELPSDITGALEVPSRAAVHLGNARLFVLSAMAFALSALWGAMLTLVVPIQVEDILRRSGMPAEQIVADKSSALAFVVASGAIVALVVPPFAGALSDRCTHSLGRRRPYIIAGVVITVAGLAAMAAPGSLLVYAAAYLIMQAGSNAAVAAYSGFIPTLCHRSSAAMPAAGSG